MLALCEHLLQSLGLGNGAGETVKDDTLSGRHLVVGVSQDVYHQGVGQELAVVDVTLGGLAQLSTCLNLGTEHIAGADVAHAVTLYNLITVGTLATARGTENNNVLHLSNYSLTNYSLMVYISFVLRPCWL